MSIENFFIKLFSKNIGKDSFGNRYYISGNKRRIIYKGLAEPSKIPPMWHAWLHYLTNELPNDNLNKNYQWQKHHTPNLTGTKLAYQPIRKIVSSDYQPWKPR